MANDNFVEAARIADQQGEAVLYDEGRAKYKIINLDVEPDLELTDDEKIDIVAKRILARFKPAFLELAK